MRAVPSGTRRGDGRSAVAVRTGGFGRYGGSLVVWLVACGALAWPAPLTFQVLIPSAEQQDGFRVANIKSQIKRNKQNEKARLRNKAVKSSLKTAIRKYNAAVEAGDTETATVLMRDASRKLDKAVSKGVIHANQAANRKSAIAKRQQALTVDA
jgi:small subunit ribosomal protein S20